MKNKLFALLLIIGTFTYIGIASASLVSQTIPPPGSNGTVPIASSSATGGIQWVATSSLGIAGGGGGSGASTTTANTWTAPQTFPYGIFSTSTATSSNIAVLNSTFNIPANYATAGCPWNTSVTDLGGCINAAYNSASTTASSTVINVPVLPAFTTYATKITFANDNEFADLQCAPGQILEYTGATTATSGAITYNESDANAQNIKIPRTGGENCIFAGGTSLNSKATSTGIYIGGTNGEAALALYNFGAINFGTGWETASNTFMLDLYSPLSDGNVTNWQTQGYSNSGEAINLYAPHFLDTASTTNPYCLNLQQNGVAEFNVYGGSIDDCPAYIYGGNAAVLFSGVNWENPAASASTTYPKYTYLTVQSTAQYTNVTLQGGEFAIDSHSSVSTPNSFVVCGATCTVNGMSFQKNGTTTVPVAIDYSVNGTAATLNALGNANPAGAFTNFASSTTNLYTTVQDLPDRVAATFYNIPNYMPAACQATGITPDYTTVFNFNRAALGNPKALYFVSDLSNNVASTTNNETFGITRISSTTLYLATTSASNVVQYAHGVQYSQNFLSSLSNATSEILLISSNCSANLVSNGQDWNPHLEIDY
jgi:hypothetical protein